MDFLLWIALIGVIVFLLGLAYSKLTQISAQKPAIDTIPPAASPPSPVAATKPAAQASASATLQQSKKSEPASRSAKPIAVAPVKATALETVEPAVIKPIPAAEPVGPAFSQDKTAPQESTASATVNVQTPEFVVKSETPPPPSTPKLLKKPRSNGADDLTKISGIGKAIQDKLFKAGIFHYDQLTDLNVEQTAWLNQAIGFAGRAERENWPAQAEKLLAKANTTAKASVKRTAKTVKPKTTVKAKAKPAKNRVTSE